MTIHAGFALEPIKSTSSPRTVAQIPATTHFADLYPGILSGTWADGNPVVETTTTHTGSVLGMAGDELFNRIHTTPDRIDFGNLVSPTSRTWTVWNAYNFQNQITSVDGDESGFDNSYNPTPTTLRLFQEINFDILADLSGAGAIDTTLAFNFATGETRTLRLTYGRILALGYLPDWTAGIVERLEWKTDVLQSHSGFEQRRRLRKSPRRKLEFDVATIGQARREFEAKLFAWGAQEFSVPIWFDGTTVTADTPAGSLTIPCDTTGREFVIGGTLVWLSQTGENFVSEILNIAPGLITLKSETGAAITRGDYIYPAVPARLNTTQSGSRFTGDATFFRFVFESLTPPPFIASADLPEYKTFPVIDEPGEFVDMPYAWERIGQRLDGETGTVYFDDFAQLPMISQEFRLTATTRTERNRAKAILARMEGRLSPVWIPTHTDDLKPAQRAVSSFSTWVFESTGYSTYFAMKSGRNHVRILLANGTTLYRKIIAAREIVGGEELTFDEPFAFDIEIADVVQICFLQLMRLNADQIELAHWTGDAASLVLPLRGFNNDI